MPFSAPSLLAGGAARADLLTYDFCTGTGSHTTGASTTFLPDPAVGGGSDRVRIGTTGGSFDLVNPGDALGTDTELQGTAPTSTSVNKFSIYDIATPTPQFYASFKLKLTGGASGTWYMFMGDGTSYSDNNGFTGTQVVSGLRWTFGASGAITENYRNAGAWSALPDSFSQDTEYFVEVYANNASTATTYAGGAQSLAAGRWDLWVNSSLVGDDLARAQQVADTNIDSIMFYGESSTANVAKIILDDMTYSTTLAAVPEPATAGLLGLGLLVARCFRTRR
ncbi:MAG: PEP-CTERM sorting domain-containing protein [Kiritimatiellia bacterium]